MSKTTTISIPSTVKITAPAGTKIIRNDDFIILARKDKNRILIFTCQKEEIKECDLLDETNWTQFNRWELEEIIKKNQIMKKTLYAFIFLALIYFCGAFITFDFNPMNWWLLASEWGRFILLWVIAVFIILVTGIEKL